ncbi:unnamed protein product [Linum tenue]|uniref:Inner centromere protein ARK-binding domain-containing protein n=1 Tax=Linum tenue TaxID=586396 RepID=A0AAV0LHQ3_9ROSI|nr:unnamed protein product [Linum tenue]
MTIVEKLIVQIFERHKSILEQVRKQTELFDQHLASKCVLDGISPPPWLLSLSLDSLSLHPSGLKKEELISGLLLPRSQAPSFYPSVHHPHSKRPFLPTSSKQEKPFDPAANEVQPNCLEREVHDFNTVNDSVGQFSVLSQFPATDTPGALNHARDSQDHDNCTDHSRSLVRIERSKSRQRALEIRSSARSAKLRANDENGDPGSCQNNVHSTKGEVKVAESWRKEGSSGHDNVRIQSGALCQLSSHMNELLSKKKSSDIVKKDLPRESTCMSMQQSNYADRMSEAANFTMAADEICATEEVNGGDCIINEGGSFIHSGGARSSRHSSLQNNALKAASDEVKSVNNGAKGGRFEHSSERSSKQATNDNRLQESAKPSATFSGSHERSNLKMTDNGSIEMGSNGDFVRVTRSTRSNRSQQDIAVGEPNRLSQLLLSSRVIGKEVSYPEQEGTHPNGLTVRTTIFDSKKCGAVPADSGINSPGLVVADSLTSRSNSGAHSIGVTSRSESEDDMLMKPKQLDFDDMEVNRTSISDVQDDNGIMSSKQSPAERRSSCSSTEVTSVGHIEQNSLLPNTPCLSGFDSQEKPRKDSSQDLGKDTVNSASNMNSVQEQNSIAFAQNPYLCTSFMGSWPQYKRMKVGDRPSYPCSTTSNLTTVQFQPFPQYNLQKAISSDDHKHPGEEMLQDSDKNTVKAREVLSSKMQVKEDEHTMGGRDKSEYAALSFMHEHLEANPLSSLTKLSTGSSEGYFSGQAKVWEPTEMAGLQFSHESEVFSRQVSESFYLGRLVTESILQMTNSDAGGTHNPPVYPVAALVSVDSTAPDENGPELEKFVVETNDKEPSTAGHPPTISTSLFGNLAEDADANKQFESTSSNYLGDLSGFTSHEIYVFPTDSAPFIHGSSKVYSSPVRKFWEPMPLKSLSSERQASSIPDLPSINEEETENMDDDIVITSPENAIKIVERKPLVDIMESANPPASICNEDDVIDDRYSIASVCTEFSVAGSVCKLETGNRRISRSRYGYATSNKGKSKQRQQQLRVPLGVKRSNGSLQNSLFSKPPKLLRKNEPRKFSAGLLEKAPKHNNIVSNVTSFVPLVQQQKRMAAAAAAAVTGKRDIKVKSLEAAEAAKRLAEKKENDKRLKKEALKLERRARIEEQNLRQLELEKERKEEQKKEAEMAAKKRQREEEQKKERERKRKRIEDKRKQNMEQRDKMNYGDKEETKCGREAPDVKASKLMENVEEERMVKATGTTNPIGSAAYDTRNMNSVDNSKDVMENQICEGKENNYSLESDIVPARSYEISPYKGSDDEDEEAEDDDDDDKPNTKFIPSWSRRRGITFTILSQQAKLDPATVFPLESFISKDQVILPRKLRHL